jgi:hypothetical protein
MRLASPPLTLADVLWFHPPGDDNVYEALRDDVDLLGEGDGDE